MASDAAKDEPAVSRTRHDNRLQVTVPGEPSSRLDTEALAAAGSDPSRRHRQEGANAYRYRDTQR